MSAAMPDLRDGTRDAGSIIHRREGLAAVLLSAHAGENRRANGLPDRHCLPNVRCTASGASIDDPGLEKP
jgi:hypothetical protein